MLVQITVRAELGEQTAPDSLLTALAVWAAETDSTIDLLAITTITQNGYGRA